MFKLTEIINNHLNRATYILVPDPKETKKYKKIFKSVNVFRLVIQFFNSKFYHYSLPTILPI